MTPTLLTYEAESPAVVALLGLLNGAVKSEALRQEAGTTTDLETLDYIYAPFLEDERQLKRPFVCVKLDGFESRPSTAGERNQTLSTGTLMVMIGRGIKYAADPIKEHLSFVDWSSNVMRQMAACSGEGTGFTYGYEWVTEPQRTNPLHIAHDQAAKPYYLALFAVEWAL